MTKFLFISTALIMGFTQTLYSQSNFEQVYEIEAKNIPDHILDMLHMYTYHHIITSIPSVRDVEKLKKEYGSKKIKAVRTHRIKCSVLSDWSDSLEYIEVFSKLILKNGDMFPYLKVLLLWTSPIYPLDFEKNFPNIEVLSGRFKSPMKTLPSKLKRLYLSIYNPRWDGQIPLSFFYHDSLEFLSVIKYKPKDKMFATLPTYLPLLSKDNNKLRYLSTSTDIAAEGVIDNITKFKRLEVLGVVFSKVPSESELKKLSYIDYIEIADYSIKQANIELLAERLGKKIVYQGGLSRTILH